ncbi:MAG: ABC transporter permease [Variibacter sp.]
MAFAIKFVTPSRSRHSAVIQGGALLLPATLMVTFVTLLPLLLMLRYSFNEFDVATMMRETFTLANYQKFITDEFYRSVLVTTFLMAAISTLTCLLLGFPVAYVLARAETQRAKSILLVLVIAPLLMGNAARTAGWMILLADRGLVNGALLATGLLDEPVRILYTGRAVYVGLVAVLLPFMIMAIQTVIEGISKDLEDGASSLGAGPFTVFRRVLLPLAMPGLFAGASLCFILAMSAYATPLLLGGPSFNMMAPIIYQQITRVSNWPFGASLAIVLIAVTVATTVISSLMLQRRYGRM